MSARTISDPDIWWHLRTGQLILQDHHVLHQDPYSFTRAGQPWVNHEWLFDVLVFVLYSKTGTAGLTLIFAAINAAALLTAFLRCVGKPYVAGISTVFAAVASSQSWGVRPQILSLLLAGIFLLLMDRPIGNSLWPWATVPLTLLWVNLHAEYALGIGLIVLFLLGTVLDATLGLRTWADARPQLRRLTMALLACIAMVPINPNGVRMYSYPLETLRSPSMHAYIQEWFSPNFHGWDYFPLLLLILAVVVTAAISSKRLGACEFLLLAVSLFGALRSVRHIPIFALVAVPILSKLAEGKWNNWFRRSDPNASSKLALLKMLANTIILFGFAAFSIVHVRSVISRQSQTETEKFPAAAVSFLAKAGLPSPILNHYNWGGYLIWKLFPRYRVFIDGRADLYGDKMMDEFAAVYYVKDNWKPIFDSWGIRTVILPPDAPLVVVLRDQPVWKELYRDQQAVILTREQP